MEKQKSGKGARQFVCAWSLVFMALLFALVPSEGVQAKNKKDAKCALKSVTLKIDGKSYVCDGGLQVIPVSKDEKWYEFFQRIKITDYEVLADVACSHKGGA